MFTMPISTNAQKDAADARIRQLVSDGFAVLFGGNASTVVVEATCR